jgi:hypothetical protein
MKRALVILLVSLAAIGWALAGTPGVASPDLTRQPTL